MVTIATSGENARNDPSLSSASTTKISPVPSCAPEPDAVNFGYRVTLPGPDGPITKRVAADQVPAALVASIQTQFR